MNDNQNLTHDHFSSDLRDILKQRFADSWGGSNPNGYAHDTDAINLGKYIRDSRILHDLSRDNVAISSGVPLAEIVAIENGVILSERIKDQTLCHLANVLDENLSAFELILNRPIQPQNQTIPLSTHLRIFSAYFNNNKYILVSLLFLGVISFLLAWKGISLYTKYEAYQTYLHFDLISSGSNRLNQVQQIYLSQSGRWISTIIITFNIVIFLAWILIKWDLPTQKVRSLSLVLRKFQLQVVYFTIFCLIGLTGVTSIPAVMFPDMEIYSTLLTAEESTWEGLYFANNEEFTWEGLYFANNEESTWEGHIVSDISSDPVVIDPGTFTYNSDYRLVTVVPVSQTLTFGASEGRFVEFVDSQYQEYEQIWIHDNLGHRIANVSPSLTPKGEWLLFPPLNLYRAQSPDSQGYEQIPKYHTIARQSIAAPSPSAATITFASNLPETAKQVSVFRYLIIITYLQVGLTLGTLTIIFLHAYKEGNYSIRHRRRN